MKAQILKIAGVKDEQEFYRKFPTEEAFMKVHGKAFKKAQVGANIPTRNISLPGFPVIGNTSALPMFDESNYMKENSPATTYGDLWNNTAQKQKWGLNNINIGKTLQTGLPLVGNLIAGIQTLGEEKRQLQRAKQWKGVTDIQKTASQLQPEITERRYIRPEDVVNTGEEYFPIYGAGTDALAKNGRTIKAADGTSVVPWGSIGNMGSNILTSIMGEDGGGMIGGSIGEGIGSIWGPMGGAIGKVGGQLVGSLIDTRPEKIKHYKELINKNIGTMALGEGMQGVFNQNNKYMRTGGQLKNNEMYLKNGSVSPISDNTIEFNGASHDNGGISLIYGGTPVEVEGGETAIKSPENDLIVFGGMKAPGYKKSFKNVVKDIAMKENKATGILDDSLQKLEDFTITTPYDRMKYNSLISNVKGSQMALRKYADEKMHLASLQEAINATADEMGMNADSLASGNVKVAKNGATIKKAQDGYSFGKAWEEARKAKAQQFYFDNTKYDVRTGSEYDKSPFYDIIKKYFPKSEWDNAYRVMMAESGGNPNITNTNNNPKISNPKGKYWNSQDSGLFQINDVAHPNVYSGGDVFDPEYNIKSAADIYKKHGWSQWTAAKKPGVIVSPISSKAGKAWTDYKISQLPEEKAFKDKEPIAPWAGNSEIMKIWTDYKISQLPTEEELKAQTEANAASATTTPPPPKSNVPSVTKKTEETKEAEKEGFDWNEAFNTAANIIPYLRPSDTEELDPRQLLGELSALQEKEEPVQAQLFRPQLTSPYKVSFQDQLNEITAQSRAAQRMAGSNPAAQAIIASQAYSAKNKVMADEFRVNQEMENKAYAENRNLMNQAMLQNLSILDKQYERQAAAKSNTKAILRSALSSISDKYLKNQLENRTLATYENLYNYRFDPRFRARNYNAPVNWDIYGGGRSNQFIKDQYDFEPSSWDSKTGEPTEYKRVKKSSPAKNGAIVKAINDL